MTVQWKSLAAYLVIAIHIYRNILFSQGRFFFASESKFSFIQLNENWLEIKCRRMPLLCRSWFANEDPIYYALQWLWLILCNYRPLTVQIHQGTGERGGGKIPPPHFNSLSSAFHISLPIPILHSTDFIYKEWVKIMGGHNGHNEVQKAFTKGCIEPAPEREGRSAREPLWWF